MANTQKSIHKSLSIWAKMRSSVLGTSLIVLLLLLILPSSGTTEQSSRLKKSETVIPKVVKNIMDKITGGKKAIKSGRVKLSAPIIAENGAVVPVQVEVHSPMTKEDYVKMIVIIVDKNPFPLVAKIHFTPELVKAYFNARVRFSKTSMVRAYAVMSNGKVYYNSKLVKVLRGC